MALATLPNIELILGSYLNEHPDLVALGARSAGRIPDKLTKPWVRVTMLDADTSAVVEHTVSYPVTFECYAGDEAMHAHVGQMEATTLALALRAVLKAMEDGQYDDLVVSRVVFTNHVRSPDDALGEPARERVVLDATISGRPA